MLSFTRSGAFRRTSSHESVRYLQSFLKREFVSSALLGRMRRTCAPQACASMDAGLRWTPSYPPSPNGGCPTGRVAQVSTGLRCMDTRPCWVWVARSRIAGFHGPVVHGRQTVLGVGCPLLSWCRFPRACIAWTPDRVGCGLPSYFLGISDWQMFWLWERMPKAFSLLTIILVTLSSFLLCERPKIKHTISMLSHRISLSAMEILKTPRPSLFPWAGPSRWALGVGPLVCLCWFRFGPGCSSGGSPPCVCVLWFLGLGPRLWAACCWWVPRRVAALGFRADRSHHDTFHALGVGELGALARRLSLACLG